MNIRRRSLLAGATALAMPAIRSYAATGVKIGVLSDMSGQYAEASGPGDFLAAQMAAEDFMKTHPAIPVEVIQGDMLLKPDVGASIARSWYDQEGVDAIFDIPQSAVAIAVGQVARDKDKVVVFTSAGIPDLTGKYCTPNQIQWTYDLWSNSNAITRGLVQAGGDSWFFIKPDYISGHTMTKDTATIVEQMGGKVAGMAAYPFPGTTDFSSQLVQAQASGAKVICLANAGDDTVNCIKQANEFGILKSGVKIGALVFQDYQVHALGLPTAQGLVCTLAQYWNQNAGTRAFADRFAPLYHNSKPNMFHAGAYSATWHCLKAVAAMGVDKAKASGRAIAEQMKAMPTDDPLYGQGRVRPDGKFVHKMYVCEVKTPAESKEPWDYFKTLSTIPTEQAFKPMEAACPLVKA
jgi:branched-chain amino acid transport system substrate-binding protein